MQYSSPLLQLVCDPGTILILVLMPSKRGVNLYHISSISLDKQMIWVSLRSVDDFPCNEVAARFFNGGGHLNASGGKLACTLPEAVDIVKQAFIAFEDRLK